MDRYQTDIYLDSILLHDHTVKQEFSHPKDTAFVSTAISSKSGLEFTSLTIIQVALNRRKGWTYSLRSADWISYTKKKMNLRVE